jgi:hypothetical protein
MHDSHDLDLIADYAGGTLDGDTAEAARLVATCDECRAEYHLHREVAAWLRSAPPVTMTEAERAAFHAGVAAGVERDAKVVTLPARRQWRWTAIGSVAAAMLVTVGVAGVLQTGLGRGGAGSDTTAAGSEVAAAEGADLTAERYLAEDADGAEIDASTDNAETTSAETITAPSEQAYAPIVDLGELPLDGLLAEIDELVVTLPDSAAVFTLTPDDFGAAELPTPVCFTSPETAPALVATATVDRRAVEAFVVVDPDGGDYRVEAFLPDEACAVLELDRE